MLFLSRRQHYLSISAPALALPEVEPTPGPGHYNLVNYEGEEKRYMSSSMFVSTTNRWNPEWEAETEVPGPSKFCTDMGLIPAGGPIVDELFSAIPY